LFRVESEQGINCVLEDDVTIKYGTILTGDVLLKKSVFSPNVITLGQHIKGLSCMDDNWRRTYIVQAQNLQVPQKLVMTLWLGRLVLSTGYT